MKKILKNKKINFKCNYENFLKFLRKRNMRKIVVRKVNVNSIPNKYDPLMKTVTDILTSY